MLLDAVCRQHDWSKRLPTCGFVGFVRNQHDSCQFPSGRRGSGIEAKAALKAWLAGVPGFNVDIMLTWQADVRQTVVTVVWCSWVVVG